MERNDNLRFGYSTLLYNHGDSCYGNRSEEVTGDGATVNMEMSLMNQSKDDDHSGGQGETRGSRLLCGVVNECCHGDDRLPR